MDTQKKLRKGWGVSLVFSVVWGFFTMLSGCTYVHGGTDGEEAPMALTVLDVGQGLSVLMEWQGRYGLYDAGPDSVGVMDTLLARGVDTLEWVVLSHYHRDHAGGFLELNGSSGQPGVSREPRIHVRRLFVGPDTAIGFVSDSVMGLARRFDIPVDTLTRGATLGFAEGPQLETLWPPSYGRVGENGASVVLLVKWGAASALLTGDLDSLGERRLLELSPSLSAELLQVGHHGSAGSSTLRFLAQVSPQYAAISVGADNGYGHPTASVLNKLKYVMGDSLSIFRTDLQGPLKFSLYKGLGVIME